MNKPWYLKLILSLIKGKVEYVNDSDGYYIMTTKKFRKKEYVEVDLQW